MADDRPETVAAADRESVRDLLGREPLAGFTVVVRRTDATPVVIRNDPLLPDGTPMPTRYWLLDRALNREIGRLEAAGGVDAAEREVDGDELVAVHTRYARERDAAIPAGHRGPLPSGGVGGTRVGVKCLHTHYAHFLATGDDPVGRWVADRLPPELREIGQTRPPTHGTGPTHGTVPTHGTGPTSGTTDRYRPEEHTDG